MGLITMERSPSAPTENSAPATALRHVRVGHIARATSIAGELGLDIVIRRRAGRDIALRGRRVVIHPDAQRVAGGVAILVGDAVGEVDEEVFLARVSARVREGGNLREAVGAIRPDHQRSSRATARAGQR
jgi:hypothetical protein